MRNVGEAVRSVLSGKLFERRVRLTRALPQVEGLDPRQLLSITPAPIVLIPDELHPAAPLLPPIELPGSPRGFTYPDLDTWNWCGTTYSGPLMGPQPADRPAVQFPDAHTVILNGTDGDDDIRIVLDAEQRKVIVFGLDGVEDGTEYGYPATNQIFPGDQINIRGHGGNDRIQIDVAGNHSFMRTNVDVEGGAGDDTITGSASWMYGGAGDDHLTALGYVGGLSGDDGSDTLVGNGYVHQFDGGRGNDTIDAGAAVGATLHMAGHEATSGAVVRLDLGTVPNDGYGDSDIISGIDNVSTLTPFDDVIHGNDNANHIVADRGNDLIVGNGGDDFLGANGSPHGADGRHTIMGGDGNDTIHGGHSANYIDGGAGADTIAVWGTLPIVVEDPADIVTHHPFVPCSEEPGCSEEADKKDKEKQKDKKAKAIAAAKKEKLRVQAKKLAKKMKLARLEMLEKKLAKRR